MLQRGLAPVSRFEGRNIGDSNAGVMSTQQRITLGMCLNNATALMAAQVSPEAQPQNLVRQIFDLTDELYAEYNNRYN